MTAQNKYQTNVQPFLPPEEQFVAAFSCQSGINPMWALVSSLIYAATLRRRMVVVTDQAIYLCAPAFMRTYKPRKVLEHYVLGATFRRDDDSKMWSQVTVGSHRLWTHKKESGNVRQASRLSQEYATSSDTLESVNA